ncbi:MAG: hemerythrin domain-containing protein [Chthonomonadales bacterium]|nr:hemerythrin domain-containing protein [Chthonomonadales bacterium]
MERGASELEVVASFDSLLAAHRAFDELFAEHQEALLDRDIAVASRKLAAVDADIREHIALEEDTLFPIYRRAGDILGGDVTFYQAEHRKMEQYLDRFRDMVAALRCGDADAQAILRLLDEETRFKHLMEHHDLRERNILYPVLDRVASAEERRAILSR